jgi:hypothetical protein
MLGNVNAINTENHTTQNHFNNDTSATNLINQENYVKLTEKQKKNFFLLQRYSDTSNIQERDMLNLYFIEGIQIKPDFNKITLGIFLFYFISTFGYVFYTCQNINSQKLISLHIKKNIIPLTFYTLYFSIKYFVYNNNSYKMYNNFILSLFFYISCILTMTYYIHLNSNSIIFTLLQDKNESKFTSYRIIFANVVKKYKLTNDSESSFLNMTNKQFNQAKELYANKLLEEYKKNIFVNLTTEEKEIFDYFYDNNNYFFYFTIIFSLSLLFINFYENITQNSILQKSMYNVLKNVKKDKDNYYYEAESLNKQTLEILNKDNVRTMCY